jgi:tetratricopeptide (TPR) repeat protein
LIRKSQIAIEYAYRVRESAPQTWVFWVNGSNDARFRQAYTDIAARVELPGRDDPKADILRLLYNWLCDERNGQWLIILDNADDSQVLHSTGVDSDGVPHNHETAPLASFLPQSSNGQLLVTSRDLVAALNLVGTGNVFRVEPMVEKEALMLLKTRISIGKAFENDAKTLVKRLGYIPLAITQAAAYIEVRAQTITTYLKLFCESEENQAHLLSNQEVRDMRRDGSVSSAVITTWQMSFKQIQKTKPEAAELLSLMAMFDRQGIPESILLNGGHRLQFEDAVATLISFSLIKARSTKQPDQQVKGRLFDMHDLVQLATRKWLELEMQVVKWQRESLRLMAISFPSGDYETWAACRLFLPHVRKVLGYILEDTRATLDRARIAQNAAMYLESAGEYVAAETIGRTALMERGKVLGIKHIDTLSSFYHLGIVLKRQRKYKEAEAMHRRALEGMEKLFGKKDERTLLILGGLGVVLECQGKYKEAEAMNRRALEGMENILGKGHISTLTSASRLGSVFEAQGKYKEAEAMKRRAAEGYKIMVGEEHPNTLGSLCNLSMSLSIQGQWKEAEDMLARVIETTKRVLGREHPNTLIAMTNLAVAIKRQKRNKEAISLMETCFQMRAKVLGRHHVDTENSLTWLNMWRKEDI